jgi:osmotically inducible lipoprotein OsmB
MNTLHHTTVRRFGGLLALTLALGLTACAGMTQQEKNTAIGAGVGAVSGSVLTGGGTLGTLGGAAIGGVIGNQIEDKK